LIIRRKIGVRNDNQSANGQSSGSSKINADFNSVGNSDGSDFLHLCSCAFEVDISLEDAHLPVVPGL
jgi:hypothetical protein